jgi:hypothetical protein
MKAESGETHRAFGAGMDDGQVSCATDAARALLH